MRKVGILTYYYNTTNYGGILQAYALCKKINTLNNELIAEQICYEYDSAINQKKTLVQLAKLLVKKILSPFLKKYRLTELNKKRMEFKKFEQSIPHSKSVFACDNINETNDLYDIFVVGSDQVWNPISIDSNFFLEFVKPGKKKIAYAASLGADDIQIDRLDIIRNKISSFDSISVREESSLILIGDIGKPIYRTIDPVFLIDKGEWIQLIKDEDTIAEAYVFVYFLSNDSGERQRVEKYAKENKLLIADFSPFQLFGENHVDCSNMGPQAFLRGIQNAEICFTDSFHCTAFCTILGIQFMVSLKKAQQNVTANDRIINILKDLNLTDHIWGTDNRVASNDPSNQEYIDEKINTYRKEGMEFLSNALVKNYEKKSN